MKLLLIFTSIFFLRISCSTAQISNVKTSDLNPLVGNWTGTLTYLDYSTGKPFTMPADVDITMVPGSVNDFVFFNSYPKESNANSMDTIHVSADGKIIDGEKVISNHKLENGNLKIITETSGKDGNDDKSALIHHTYTIGKETFVIVKEVQFTGEKNWLKRHEYNYVRRK